MKNTAANEWISMNEAAMRHGCDRAMIRKRIAVGMLESRQGISPYGGSAPVLVRAADVGPALLLPTRTKVQQSPRPAAPPPPMPPEGWVSIKTASRLLHADRRSILDRVTYGHLEARDFAADTGTWKIVNLDAAREALKVSIRPQRSRESTLRAYAAAERVIAMLDADEGNLTECCRRVGFTVSNVTNWVTGSYSNDETRQIGARVRAASERQQERARMARHAEMRAFIEVAKGCTSIGEAVAKAGITRSKANSYNKSAAVDASWYPGALQAAIHGSPKMAERSTGPKMSMGRVYVIGPKENGPVKVGFTAYSAENRLRDIQTGHPETLTLLAVGMGTRHTERTLHSIFAPYRQSGEWFTLSRPVRALIRALAARGPAEAISDALLTDLRRLVESDTRPGVAQEGLFDPR